MMRAIKTFILAFLIAIISTNLSAAEADFYVSPRGNDDWSGRLAEPRDDGGDGPLATLAAARDKIRLLKKQGPLERPLRVLVRGGTYRLEQPVSIKPEDSGTVEAPIIYAAFPGEKPIISGGIPIAGWKKGPGPLWTVEVPAARESARQLRQLFVGGRRCTPARTPNEGYFYTAGPAAEWTDRDKADADERTKTSFRYQGDDLRPWNDIDDAVVVVYHSWTASRHYVKSLDTAGRIVHFTAPSDYPMGYFGKSQRYYVESIREALDAPGEWHLDRRTGGLSYFPRPGEDMTRVEAVLAETEELLRLEGDPANDTYVDNLRFEGLSFQHVGYTLGRDESADGYGAAFLRKAAISALGARHCVFARCEIAHTGGHAVWLSLGCHDNLIEQCHLHDLGAGGVWLGDCLPTDLRVGGVRVEKDNALPPGAVHWPKRNVIHNCFIHDGGNVFHAGIGVLIGRCSYTTVSHNEICDMNYSGVSVGWAWWPDPPAYAHHNLIEFNHVHNLGRRQLSDMAGIYLIAYAPGTRVSNNVVHDIHSHDRRGWGLYADEGCAETVWENNIVYRARDGAFHDHLGRDNLVRNNIFALAAAGGQISRNPLDQGCSFVVERNIVYDRAVPPLSGNWTTPSYKLDHNLYWNAAGKPLVFPGEKTFEQWQAAGQDANSLAADPLFVDAERFDFRLKEDSPALKLGFRPIDTSNVGLVGRPDWVGLPKSIERPAWKLPGEE